MISDLTRQAPAIDKAATQALAGLYFSLLLTLCISHSTFRISHFFGANGDLQEARRPGSRTTKLSFDGDSRLLSTSNPGANSGTRREGFVYDTTPAGKPRTVNTQADAKTVTSEFDAMGRLRFLKDRKNATFEFRYDALGRRTHVITPQSQATITGYKKNGRVETITEPSGDTATFNYNATTGRLSSVVYSGTGGGTVNYTGYDNNGNLLTLNENGVNGITRTYDGLNRVTSYTFAGQTIGYRYYPSGKLAKLIYPGGTENGVGHVEYTYHADGRLYQVIDKLDSTTSPRTTTYTWRTDGRLEGILRPNGTTRTISYDTAGRPDGIAESAGLNWTIGYWPSDDIRTLDVTPAIPANQLSAVPNASMTFDSANQLATFNGNGVTHDPDGNMTNGPKPDGGTAVYSYDSRNRLTGMGVTAYSYNAENNRIGITSATETTTFVVDPEGVLPKVLSRTKNGVTTRYVYGAGLQYEVSSAGAATYYHYDQSGNTAALSNQAGTLIERVAYSPYGTIRYRQSNFDTPFLYGGFFGVMTDANGLVNMRARYYNPATMRFVNSDPARDGLNWYAFANANPIGRVDPTGLGSNKVLGALNSGLSYLGYSSSQSAAVRLQYVAAVAPLNPNDVAGRSAVKAQYRALTPQPFRAYIDATRPSLGPTAGSQGHANTSNAGVNALGRNLGNIGNGLLVVGAGVEVYNVANAPQGQKLQTVAGAGGRTLGGIGGGIAGAEAGAMIGAYGGPWGAVGGAIVGGIVGSVSGGWAAGQTAEEIYLNLTPEEHRY